MLRHDFVNYFYFFLPLIIIHNLAWGLKPWITDDSRGPWEIIWHRFLALELFKDRFHYFVHGTILVTTLVYWSTALLFMLLDFTQFPKFLVKYKIQEGKNAPPDTYKVIKVIATVLFNQALGFPAAYLNYFTWTKRNLSDLSYVPSTVETFGSLFLCMLGHDFIFYHGHKLLHHPALYKHIHKKHHEWQAPIAAAAVYAHPVEHALTGIISTSAGLAILASPIPIMWLWYCWIGFQVQNDHSGYHFPLMFSPEFHDYHHLKFHTSYGWLSFWDWAYGTDWQFQKSQVHRERNIRLHTTQSAKEIFPDAPKKD